MGFVVFCCSLGQVGPSVGRAGVVLLCCCVCRAAEGEAIPRNLRLPVCFVKTWGSILTFSWPPTLLLMGHLSRVSPTSLIPSSHQGATPAGSCQRVPPQRWKRSPKQAPPLPPSQVSLIGTLATHGVSLPPAVTLLCLAQPGRELGATLGAASCPTHLGNGPQCSPLAAAGTPSSSQDSSSGNKWEPVCSV